MFEFVGRLMGTALRTSILLPLDLPTLFWKQLVNEAVTVDDLRQIDRSFTDGVLDKLDVVQDEADFKQHFGASLTYATTLSDETRVELWPGSGARPVAFVERHDYARRVLNARLHESNVQMAAIRRGLRSVVSDSALALSSAADLELLVCGSTKVDVELLQRHTQYSGGVDPHAPHIAFFWQVLQGFSDEQRRRFLRFVWAQERLPATDDAFESGGQLIRLLIKARVPNPSVREDDAFPRADTCFFSELSRSLVRSCLDLLLVPSADLELPAYSSLDIMRQKLTAVINLAGSMDGDATAVNVEDSFGVASDDPADEFGDIDEFIGE
jgi:hypothetical protein